MFIIWGSRVMKKILAGTPLYTCPKCNNATPYQVMRVSTWFTLFWIPIFPYSIKYFMVCPICQMAIPMKKEEAKAYQAGAEQSAGQ